MINPLYFSDYIRPATNKIRFAFIVLGRFFGILFRRHKKLVLLDLDYQKKYQFDQSLLVIRYRFKNALWYCFKRVRRTTDAGVIVLNLTKIPEMPLTLIVHGFLSKKIFLIDITPEAALQTKSLRTKIVKPCNLKSYTKPVVVGGDTSYPAISKVDVNCPAFKMKPTHIHMKYPSFNQTEFL
jgi:hypothetical protein